jgi:hypothetical protein
LGFAFSTMLLHLVMFISIHKTIITFTRQNHFNSRNNQFNSTKSLQLNKSKMIWNRPSKTSHFKSTKLNQNWSKITFTQQNQNKKQHNIKNHFNTVKQRCLRTESVENWREDVEKNGLPLRKLNWVRDFEKLHLGEIAEAKLKGFGKTEGWELSSSQINYIAVHDMEYDKI